MGVSVVFEGGSDAVEVVPGEQAAIGLRLENTGMVVDRVLLDVLGDAAEWAQVEPAQVNLLPGATERARIVFTPPRAASLAPGEVPFAVRAMSAEDPEGSSIEEGLVHVAEFGDLGAQLVPKSATGRRSAKFRLVVENRGNRPEPVRVEPFDPEAKLGFKTRPGTFVARPGTATFVRVKTVPRKTFLRGPNRTLPFEVTALPESGATAADEGVMLEKQTLPEWLLPLLGVAALLCGLALVLWFTVLQPVVNSAATSAGAASSAQAQARNAAGAASAAAKSAANSNSKLGSLTTLNVKIAAPTVLTGSTDLATANGTASGGSTSNPKVVWTSSNPAVATVSQSGVVTAVSPGTATITATSATANGETPAPAAAVTPEPTLDLSAPDAAATDAPGTSLKAAPSVVSGSVTVNVVGPVSVSTLALPQAVLGKSYSESLTGTGGTGTYTWSVSSGSLPAGFTLSPDGVITGTPGAIGTTSFKVQMVNSGPPYQFAAKSFTLPTIDAPAISTSSLPGTTSGSQYKAPQLKAVFGTAPYSWSLVPGEGALPDGLSLDPNTGLISGISSKTGLFTFSVQVTDSAVVPQSATQQLSIAVDDTLAVSTPQPLKGQTTPLPQEGVKNEPYSFTLGAAGGTTPYTWSVVLGSLPLGLTMNSSGVISGTPTVSGTSPFSVKVDSPGPPAQSVTVPVSLTVVDAPVVSTSTLPGAVTGTAYSQTLAGAFGTAPYKWALVPGQGGLPAGLALNVTTGVISGTPTAAGTAPFTVQVTDSTKPSQSATQHLSIAVANPLVINTPAVLPQEGVKGAPYLLALGASGGTGPFTWSVSAGNLPLGLTLNSATGVIGGVPTVSGTTTFTAQLVDGGTPAQTSTKAFTITVMVPPSIATSSLPGATTGTAYSQTLAGAFGTAPYTWSVVPGQGDLPGGLTLDPAAGVISGTPRAAGTFAFTVQVADSTTPSQSAVQHLSIAVADPLSISTLEMPDGVVNAPYSLTLNASGGTQPYKWSVDTGVLPAGLKLDPATGVISGTPTKAVRSAFSVTATDAAHPQRAATSQPLTLIIVPVLTGTTTSLPQAAVGQVGGYNTQLTATGGTAPYVWSLTGTLPPGLTLSTTGEITGLPTQTGVFPFTVQMTDAGSPPLSSTESLTITVVGSLQVTTQSLPDVLVGQPYSQGLTAVGGTAPYTWAVSTGSLPAGLGLNPVTGVISGTTSVPTTAPASITFTVTDTGPPTQKALRTLTLRVTSPLLFSVPPVPDAIVGQPFDLKPTTPTGGSGSYVWSESGVLPAGLSLNTTTGEISGTISKNATVATYQIDVTLRDLAGGVPPATAHVTIKVVATLGAQGSYNLTGTSGTALNATIQPSGGVAPYSFAFTQKTGDTTLPSWLSLDPSTGVLSGTPDLQCSTTTDTTSADSDTFTCAPVTYTEHVTITDSASETFLVAVSLPVSVPPLVVTHQDGLQTTNSQFDFSVGTVHGGYGSGAVTFTATGLPCTSDHKTCDQIDISTGRITGKLKDFEQTDYVVTVTVTQDDPVPGSSNTYVGVYKVKIHTDGPSASASASASASSGATP